MGGKGGGGSTTTVQKADPWKGQQPYILESLASSTVEIAIKACLRLIVCTLVQAVNVGVVLCRQCVERVQPRVARIDASSRISARTHMGLIAQRIQSAFEAHGLNAADYGFFCHDSWTANEDHEAGDAYSLRYEECLCIEAAYQRRRADRLEARIAALEERLNG